MGEFALPIVDISSFLDGNPEDKNIVVKEFADAFESVGFAVITGHGIAESLTGGLYDAATGFFAQSLDTKMAYSPPEAAKSRGYLPMGMESVAKTLKGETPPDLCEALVFGAPHHEGEEGHSPNYYPDTPGELSGLVKEYTAEIIKLNAALMRLSALALDLPEDYFAPMYADPSLTLRFVNYPDQDKAPLPGQLRYGEHHDYGAITILRQDAAPGGLEVMGLDGVWHEATVVPDSFVINVGDLLSRWTNDRWRSTLHRVSNPEHTSSGSTRRLSMVAFTGPAGDTMVSALPSCVSDDVPEKYTPVSAGEYIMSKIRASHDLSNKDDASIA